MSNCCGEPKAARSIWLLVAVALVAIVALASACGDGGASAPSAEPGPATDVNPAPDVVEVKVVAQVGRVRYFSGGETDVWGYRDGASQTVTVPGPIIRAKLGDRVVVRFENRLPESTTIHWHGVRVPNMSDGTPTTQKEVAPGAEFTYEFIAEDAGTFWYHPHVRGDVQVERGLYGMLIVAGGPEVPVHADRAFVLDDVKLEASGALSTKTDALDLMLGRQGNVILVNGRSEAAIATPAGARERWRFVNAANGKYFNLRMNGRQFKVIAWDGGLVPAPYDTETLLIAPGERYEVLVTLDGAAGDMTALETIHYDRGHNVPDPGPKAILRVRLGDPAPALGALPAVWGDMPAIATTAATPTRSLVLSEEEASGPGAEPRFLINDMAFPPPIEGSSDDVVIWSVKNDSEMDHPFHLHGMFFQVLDVDGRAPEHAGWKDTVNVPQKKTLRFAVKYGRPGRWMYHCHILEHAERGMMGELVLTEKNP
jgi:FtsP/CotA-like multicopper oxidase with cupredoxin domain